MGGIELFLNGIFAVGDIVPFSGGSLACFHDLDTIPKNCQRNFIETPVKEWLFFDRSGRLRGSGLKDMTSPYGRVSRRRSVYPSYSKIRYTSNVRV